MLDWRDQYSNIDDTKLMAIFIKKKTANQNTHCRSGSCWAEAVNSNDTKIDMWIEKENKNQNSHFRWNLLGCQPNKTQSLLDWRSQYWKNQKHILMTQHCMLSIETIFEYLGNAGRHVRKSTTHHANIEFVRNICLNTNVVRVSHAKLANQQSHSIKNSTINNQKN